MSIENAREHLKKWGMDSRILEFEHSSATVDLAAQAVGCEPAHIAKSISFKQGDGALLIVTAGDTKIDNTKFRKQFAMKAKMLNPDDAVNLIGHAVGGVCPFGVKANVPIYLDISLKRFESIYPACGSSHSMIKMTCNELETCSCSTAWVDVCKGWEIVEELGGVT